jgi:hypothetical protein
MPDYTRVMFIRHKNKEILSMNFSKCNTEEFMAAITKAREIISQQSPNSLLTLTNVNDFTFNKEMSRAMKEFATHNKPFVKAAAVVGVGGLKKIIYDAIQRFSNSDFMYFNDLETAKDWLAEQ